MKRTFFWMCAALTAFVSAPLLSAGTAAANSKTVLVSVTASASGPVQGLSAGDVKMQEDKSPVEVTDIAPVTGPMSVALLLDTTHPVGQNAPTQDLRRAVTSFVSTLRAAVPDAQFAVYSVSNAAIPLSDFTSDPATIAKAIANLVIAAQSGSPMLEGVVDASQRLERQPPPRREIVAVSLGSAEAGAERPSNLARELLKSGATLWSVSVASTRDVAQAAARDEVWNKLTAASGGLGIQVVQISGLEHQMQVIANTLASQYTVTFARKSDGAVKPLTGEAKGAKILFSHWVR